MYQKTVRVHSSLPVQTLLAIPLCGMSSITCKTVKCLGSACFYFWEPWACPMVCVMMSSNSPWYPTNSHSPSKSIEEQIPQHGNTASVSGNITRCSAAVHCKGSWQWQGRLKLPLCLLQIRLERLWVKKASKKKRIIKTPNIITIFNIYSYKSCKYINKNF